VVDDGDGVDDTPAHATETWNILRGKSSCWLGLKHPIDTCKNKTGIDKYVECFSSNEERFCVRAWALSYPIVSFSYAEAWIP
jgi:hypothetical protein